MVNNQGLDVHDPLTAYPTKATLDATTDEQTRFFMNGICLNTGVYNTNVPMTIATILGNGLGKNRKATNCALPNNPIAKRMASLSDTDPLMSGRSG